MTHPNSILRRRLLALVLVAVSLFALGGCATKSRTAPFRERPDSVRTGDLHGPFSGQVIDAGQKSPIAGALVYATWSFVDGAAFNGPAGFQEYVGTTDENGYYRVPAIGTGLGGRKLAAFRLLVYKRGYVAYRSDRRFRDFRFRTDFAQRQNKVALRRWRSDLSHVRHLSYVGSGPALASLTAWERPLAAVEMANRAGIASDSDTSDETPTMMANLAQELLPLDQVKGITGYQGEFKSGKLDDKSGEDGYDTLHLRAEGKSEDFDIALRVWRDAPDIAKQRYAAILKELPNVEQKNELGSKSARVTSPAMDIFGVIVLDEERGTVVMLTCGASQCRSPEVAVRLARSAVDRLNDFLGRPE